LTDFPRVGGDPKTDAEYLSSGHAYNTTSEDFCPKTYSLRSLAAQLMWPATVTMLCTATIRSARIGADSPRSSSRRKTLAEVAQ
jgi:hypothetical protein